MLTFVIWCISEDLLWDLLGLLSESEYLILKEFFAVTSFFLFYVLSEFISLLSDSICFLLLLSGNLNLFLMLFLNLLSILFLIVIYSIIKDVNITTSLILGVLGASTFSNNNFFGEYVGFPRVRPWGTLITELTVVYLDSFVCYLCFSSRYYYINFDFFIPIIYSLWTFCNALNLYFIIITILLI